MYQNELLLGVPIDRDALKYWSNSGSIFYTKFNTKSVWMLQQNATLQQEVYATAFVGKIKTLQFNFNYTIDQLNTHGYVEVLLINESDTVEQHIISLDADATTISKEVQSIQEVLALNKDDYVNTVGVKIKLKSGKLTVYGVSLLQDSESFITEDNQDESPAQVMISYGLDAEKPKLR
jgi:hypothetical protein